ncbi:Swarming motility protein YbiA [compost metagenome]
MSKKHIYFYYLDQPFAELMNFYYSNMIIDGKSWRTVEHYFQAMKSLDVTIQQKIRNLKTPKLAKEMGQKVELRSDWDEIKEEVMLKALRAKFSQNSRLKAILLSTEDAILHEDAPKDKYWGVKGKDRLGKLLMIVREEFKNEIG